MKYSLWATPAGLISRESARTYWRGDARVFGQALRQPGFRAFRACCCCRLVSSTLCAAHLLASIIWRASSRRRFLSPYVHFGAIPFRLLNRKSEMPDLMFNSNASRTI